MRKKGEFNFEVLFAIIAGAAILFLAIYGAVKIGDTKKTQTYAETAKEISILTDPMQAGFSEGSYGKIIFKKDTVINNYCNSENFGKNQISVSFSEKIKKDETEEPPLIDVTDKYLFSSKEQGKEFYVFSAPFFLAYKVSDLTFLTSKDYCFIEAPEFIENEINSLNMKNIKAVKESKNCSKNSASVCFDSKECEIGVYGECQSEFNILSNCKTSFDYGYVEKNGERLDYAGNLMYGAIFSDNEIYECNAKRLLYKAMKLAEIYSEKSELMNLRGCNTNIQPEIELLHSLTENATEKNLISIAQVSQEIDEEHDSGGCKLW